MVDFEKSVSKEDRSQVAKPIASILPTGRTKASNATGVNEYKVPVTLDARQRQLVRRLWNDGPLSRIDLHRRTKIRPNGVGVAVDGLLQQGIVRECGPGTISFGRPPVPVELDPHSRFLLGLSISATCVQLARVGLAGQAVGPPVSQATSNLKESVSVGREMLEAHLSHRVLAVGLSVSEPVDRLGVNIIRGTADRDLEAVSLRPLFEEVGEVPITIGSHYHAAAARWTLTHRIESSEDVLVVVFGDGDVGAAMVIDGKPNRGCVASCNELGHSRFPIKTSACSCGHEGCVRQLFSSTFLLQCGGDPSVTLENAAADYRDRDEPLEKLVRLFANTLANICNFVRPHRLVLASPLLSNPRFASLVVKSIRSLVLEEFAGRMQIDVWERTADVPAETSGWLALASLIGEWTSIV